MNTLIYFVAVALCYVQPVTADPAALNCTVTSHPDGSTTYNISKAPPSDDCDTSWLAKNGTKLAVETQLLKLEECLDGITYTVQCPGVKINLLEVACTKNCSELQGGHILNTQGNVNTVSNSTLICIIYCVTPKWFGIGFSVLVAAIGVVLIIRFQKEILRCFRRRRWDTTIETPPEEVCLKSPS